MKVFVALASVVLMASPAFAQSGTGTVSGSAGELATQNDTTQTNENQASNGERVICRHVEIDSSTRRGRRVCRTAQQWREAQRAR
jgi:type IV secretory pathway TrbL component